MFSHIGGSELLPQFGRPADMGTKVVQPHGNERLPGLATSQRGGPIGRNFNEREFLSHDLGRDPRCELQHGPEQQAHGRTNSWRWQ